jgi:C4-dicarboxylate-specific signal transduction histidine kinase
MVAAHPNHTPAQINWKAWMEAGSIWLSITDNGPGATNEQLTPLFDEGAPIGIRSGLGLHIVRDTAKAIGCELHTHSPHEGGLEVCLTMRAQNP